jgi:hypothetical protein
MNERQNWCWLEWGKGSAGQMNEDNGLVDGNGFVKQDIMGIEEYERTLSGIEQQMTGTSELNERKTKSVLVRVGRR